MAAGSTYTPIATYTATGSQSAIDFTSIPSTYTDLVLVCNISYASLGGNTGYVVNRVGNGSLDTGNNYSWTTLVGNGSAASSGQTTNAPYINPFTAVTGTNQVQIIYQFQNYSNATTYKTLFIRTTQPALNTQAIVSMWRSTSAINTIRVYDFSGYNFSSTSIFTLYGIAAA